MVGRCHGWSYRSVLSKRIVYLRIIENSSYSNFNYFNFSQACSLVTMSSHAFKLNHDGEKHHQYKLHYIKCGWPQKCKMQTAQKREHEPSHTNIVYYIIQMLSIEIIVPWYESRKVRKERNPRHMRRQKKGNSKRSTTTIQFIISKTLLK